MPLNHSLVQTSAKQISPVGNDGDMGPHQGLEDGESEPLVPCTQRRWASHSPPQRWGGAGLGAPNEDRGAGGVRAQEDVLLAWVHLPQGSCPRGGLSMKKPA